MNTLKAAFMSGLALELISTLSVAIIAVLIGIRLVNGSIELYAGLMVLTLAAEVYLPLRDIGAAYHASEDGIQALKKATGQIHQPVGKTLAQLDRGAEVTADCVSLRNVTLAYKSLQRVTPDIASQPAYLTKQEFELRQQQARQNQFDPQKQGPTYDAKILAPVVEN